MSLEPDDLPALSLDKTVVVTGGGQGIGKALAEKFASYGAKVAISDLSKERASAIAKQINGASFKCDVTRENEVQKLVSDVKKKFGSIDIFVSNAGVCFGDSNHSASASNKVWNKSWEVNVMAHVYAARASLPDMITNRKGHFVQIVSAAALLSQIGDAAYSTTKHAALGFAESLAINHKSDGIDVSLVCPQFVATEMLGYDDESTNFQNSIMSTKQLANLVVPEILNKKFLILPHPEVYDFMNFKSQSYDKWIDQMHKFKVRSLKLSGTLNIKNLHKFL